VRRSTRWRRRTAAVPGAARIATPSGRPPLTVPHEAADLFARLAPVLNVRDLAAERAFCEKLGLPVIYEGLEYPVFRRSKGPTSPARRTSWPAAGRLPRYA